MWQHPCQPLATFLPCNCPTLLLCMPLRAVQISEYNESPLLLLLDPAIDHSRKDLPLDVYETGGPVCECVAGGGGVICSGTET
jgi:hypothetical protein